MSQRIFCIAICVGAILLSISMLLELGPQDDTFLNCQLPLWSFHLGFDLLFIPLFLKVVIFVVSNSFMTSMSRILTLLFLSPEGEPDVSALAQHEPPRQKNHQCDGRQENFRIHACGCCLATDLASYKCIRISRNLRSNSWPRGGYAIPDEGM